jgi:hypothetical protein
MGLCSIVFSILFIHLFFNLNHKLNNSSNLNIDLFRTVLGISKIMSTLVSLRTLYTKEILSRYDPNIKNDFYFNDYLTEGKNLSLYYTESLNLIFILYDKTFKCFSYIENEIPSYLTKEQLIDIYWNTMQISYNNKDFITYSHRYYEDSFPMAINQLLSNSVVFAETSYFNSLTINSINGTYSDVKYYFDYLTYIIIENGYDHILPNQIKKLNEIPDILKKVNSGRTNVIITLVCIFICIMISLCVLCSF